jgi:hypothetical protein
MKHLIVTAGFFALGAEAALSTMRHWPQKGHSKRLCFEFGGLLMLSMLMRRVCVFCFADLRELTGNRVSGVEWIM